MSGISVVIPARDRERYIAEAIESLLAQTLPPQEVIVVDDGSSDGTAAAAELLGAIVVRSEGRGPAAARNLGARTARCELLAFLDSDDLATPRRLELQAEALTARPEIDGVVGRMESFVSDDSEPGLRARVVLPEGSPMAYLASTLLVRRQVFLDSGGFDDRLRAAEMIEWFGRTRTTLRFAEIDAVVMRRRVHGGNNSLIAERMRREVLSVAHQAVLRRG
jgi:glycosyltransferase involved in cell wall biosynthesis